MSGASSGVLLPYFGVAQGRDTLSGGAGDDCLDGGLLNDSMSGGAGNDTYLVDSTGDVINDLGAATDVDTVLVLQAIRYTLPANVENAAINATGEANLTGNNLNNVLTGNAGKNVLDGGMDNDLKGGAGDDNLNGGVWNDLLAGCFYGKDGGRYERDTLSGGVGADVFQLGWANGRFYWRWQFEKCGQDRLRPDHRFHRGTGPAATRWRCRRVLFGSERSDGGRGYGSLRGAGRNGRTYRDPPERRRQGFDGGEHAEHGGFCVRF